MPVVILDNIRSSYNVGSIMRTLDAVGGGEIICVGITPYPDLGDNDDRSPVVKSANTKQIAKTALGAQDTLSVSHAATTTETLHRLPSTTTFVALEQSNEATNLFDYRPPSAELALILGSETEGLPPEVLKACDAILEIPQYGQKESLNVSVAAGIALYHLTRRTTLSAAVSLGE
ncbi:MAG: TrmH family RNA methyltransferase [Solirubrobacterales bacterium]